MDDKVDDNSIGFLCGDKLITVIDDEEVVLTLQGLTISDAEPIVYTNYIREKISEECKLIAMNIEQLYSNRFYPRTYYYIFRLQLQPNDCLGFLLEQSNGTTGLTTFYPCESYKDCRELIRKEEDLED